MASNISLNQFAPNSIVAGLYVYMANLPQLHNVIVSQNQETPLTAGSVVTIDTTSTNIDAAVVKQAAVTDNIFGVVTFNPIQSQFAKGDRVAVARENDVVWLPAATAITAGAVLYFTAENQVTSSETAGNSIIGKALTPASAQGDYIQVQLGFATTEAGE